MALSQWKEAILEGIFTEIEEGFVEEKNLERLENLVEILHKEGSEVPESVKQSYCQVAVECTARSLTNKKDAEEAIRSIWLRRVMPLCDKVSCLVTRDLLISCKRLWAARGGDAKACEALMGEDTREKALASLRKVVSELHPNIDCGNGEGDEESEESSEESGETEPMVEEMDEDKGRLSDTEQERPSGALVAVSPPRRMKTISSAVTAKALEKLRASKIDLVNALAEGGGPSNLIVSLTTQQENDVASPSAANKPSLMERRITAQTYEWKDSIDDSDGETEDYGEVNNKSRGKRVVVSPFKRNQGGGRRLKIPWSTAETLAVMKGYEKYGANWKRIRDACPILVRRTNGDIKDKFRVEMRRQERHP